MSETGETISAEADNRKNVGENQNITHKITTEKGLKEKNMISSPEEISADKNKIIKTTENDNEKSKKKSKDLSNGAEVAGRSSGDGESDRSKKKNTKKKSTSEKDENCGDERQKLTERSEEAEEGQLINLETGLGGALCVFYTKSPFSDFTTAPFILEGKYYHSVEHYFQIQMLYAFGLFKLAHTLIQIADAHEFRKTLRNELKSLLNTGLFEERTLSKWKDGNAIKLMKKANRAKFDQNHALRDLLLHTGDRLLCYTSKSDKRLGLGMTEAEFLYWIRKNRLSLEDLLDFTSGVKRRPVEMGWNALGCALMEVRADYLQRQSIFTDWKQAQPDKWKAALDIYTRQLSSGEMKRLKSIQKDMEECALEATRDKIKSFKSKPTPATSSQIRVNQCLLGHFDRFMGNDRKVTESESSGQTAAEAHMETLVAKVDEVLAEYSEDKDSEKTDNNENNLSAETSQQNSVVISDSNVTSRSSDTGITVAENVTKSNDDKETPSEKSEQIISEKKSPEKSVKSVDLDKKEILVLKEEKRIVISRNDSRTKKRVIGSESDKVRPIARTKKSRWQMDHHDEDEQSPESQRIVEARKTVLGRIEQLLCEKPMINPYSIPAAPSSDQLHCLGLETFSNQQEGADQNNSDVPAGENEVVKPTPVLWPPPGTPYTIEQGEIPPDGVIIPPRGIEGPAYLLPLGRRDWIVRPEVPVRGRPAGLPMELLPPPPCPANINPLIWQQRFSRPTQPDIQRDPFAFEPLAIKPPLIFAPKVDPLDRRPKEWMPPDNPLEGTLEKAKNFIRELVEKIKNRRNSDVEEGADPTSEDLKKIIDESEEAEDPIAFCREIFPFGMEASIADLFDMGFVPPPLVGDPEAQRRNKPITVNEWMTRFRNPEEALRYWASRWIKKGRLTTTGEYESVRGAADEAGCPTNRYVNIDMEEDGDKYRRNVDTQVVYLDTSQYNQYVKWYQKVHGFAPLPSDNELEMRMDFLRSWYQYYQQSCRPEEEPDFDPEFLDTTVMGPEQLYANNYGDYWALARWKWAQWERKLERGDEAKWLEATQETITDEISVCAKPISYKEKESDDLQNDPNESINQQNPTATDQEMDETLAGEAFQEAVEEEIIVTKTILID